MKDRLKELLEKADETIIGFSIEGDIGILADHLLAEGVIVPPCKVGDTVYRPIITSRGEPAIWEIIVSRISVDIDAKGVDPTSYVIGRLKKTHCGESADFREFGKTVFLTREEAEKHLRRSKNESIHTL